ncbi:MAG: diguanylate cyclase [Magnetococcales bacterium]|nr:diguanylate cyclase [Magnetococcales bacterium]
MWRLGSNVFKEPVLRRIFLLAAGIAIFLPIYEFVVVYPKFTQSLLDTTELDALRVGRHLAGSVIKEKHGQIDRSVITPELIEDIGQIITDFHLIKIKIFTSSGEVVYSTDANEIGQVNRNDYFVDVVAKGRPFKKMVQKQGQTLEGKHTMNDVVEVYTPVLDRGNVIGAFEIYYDITDHKMVLDRLLSQSGANLVLMAVLLLGFIFMVLREAVRYISAKESAEERLLLSSKVMEHALDGVMITDQRAHIEMVNPSFVQLTGYTQEEVMGKNPRFLSSGRQTRSFYAELWHDLLGKGSWQGEIWNRRKDGAVYPEWLRISALHGRDHQISHFIAIFSDISRVKQREENLQNLAYYDALTKLPNRLLFRDRLKKAMSDARRTQSELAVMFLDLDGFKKVNDVHGHHIGDLLLQEVAQRIKSLLRDVDTVSRLGGDEFTVILSPSLPIQKEEHIIPVATKIIEELQKPFYLDSCCCLIGTSIGIGIFPRDADDLESLIKKADEAMYRAKENGKGQYQFAY